MDAFRTAAAALMGFAGGIVVSAAVFAFIAVVGIVPRMAYKTGTRAYIRVYEEAIVVGGILGCAACFVDIRAHMPVAAATAVLAFVGLLYGVFVGCVAVCLAEILNVLPILSRRMELQKGLWLFLPAFALGKLAGSLAYFFIPQLSK